MSPSRYSIEIHVLIIAFLLYAVPGRGEEQGNDWSCKVDFRLRMAWRIKTGKGGPVLSAPGVEKKKEEVILLLESREAVVMSPQVQILARQGEVATARIELDKLPLIAQDPAIRYIRGESRWRLHDDPGVMSVRAERVPPKLGLTGKGVLIGILDTGIDWQHRDFLYPDSSSRIAAILDLSDPPDSLQSGDLGSPDPYDGILVTQEEINQALKGEGRIRHRDYVGHGTHVAGAAAASPAPSPDTLNVYGGVAPGAELIAVKVSRTPRDSSLSDVKILSGLYFVDSYARKLGRPYVINLSLGGDLGAHDGSSAGEKFIASFTASEKKGQAVVISAGNGRKDGWHAQGDFAAKVNDSTPTLKLVVDGEGSNNDRMSVEVWLSTGHPGLVLGLISPDSQLRVSFTRGYADTLLHVTDQGVIAVSNSYGGVDPESGDRLVWVDFYDAGNFNISGPGKNVQIQKGTWQLVLMSHTGSFDAYLSATDGLKAHFGNYVTELGTVGEPGTCPEVITVGAYVARTDWRSLAGGVEWASEIVGQSVPGELASFSSLGPNRKGVLKPEITAPGQWIMSTMSRWAWPLDPGSISIYRAKTPLLPVALDSIHAISAGTSFSAPIVAGICALLLEKNPDLTHPQIKDILTRSAATDSITAGAPNNYWGYGRANAIGALVDLQAMGKDSLALEGRLDPADTLRSDSLKYTITADFTRSSQVMRSFELEITWPSRYLSLVLPLESGQNPLRLKLDFDTTRIGGGILGISGVSYLGLAAREEVIRLTFTPRTAAFEDSVKVSFQAKSLRGDLEPAELAGTAGFFQAGPVTLRPVLACAVKGDTDLNGRLDIFDLLEMLRILSGQARENGCSDINLDSRTDIFDLLEILRLF